ncbi:MULTISPECIES: restriction endonuclease subunit S [Acinetobacter]|uniref:restriction endonuclease subunit S n=1 Tax=Acinetobacter TaxID=469 RepID=UPI000B34CCD0|nr:MULTISPECIES: restriction endonuclease subunit S [Acinetobacter]MDS7925828.1 restriction endonuclease subunit S [Acinetobacter sp. V115_6]
MALTRKISDIIKEDTTGLLSKHPSWLRIELSNVATILNGFAFPSSYFNNDGIGLPLIRIRDVTEGNTTTYYNGDYDDIYLVNKNEILVGMDGDFNLGLWKSSPSLLNQRVCKISLKNDNIYDKQFLIYLLPPYLKAINDATSSITVKHLSSKTLNEILLPLPPLNEQKRIADKIDELFSELDNGIEELETAQKKLELYRQSLLKSAVEGKLSKEWRETQTEISETGKQLLERILKERRERWAQEKLNEFNEKGKTPPKNWQEKYPEPVQPYDSINLPKLPNNWTWASLDQLAYPIRNGMSPKPNIEEKGYPILRINAVRAMKVHLDECRHIDLPYESVKNFIIKNNDILITRYNGSIDLLGVFGVVRDLDKPMLHPDKLIRAQPILGETLSNWIELAANIGHSRGYVKSRAKTTSGQTGVSGEDIKQTPIALPPLTEQLYLTNLISLKLENISNQFDSLAIILKQTSDQKLNVLKDAFNGSLVYQDPNDEPAQILLERIQQQKEAEFLAKKNNTQKSSTPKVKKEVSMSKTILDVLKNQSDWISGQELATAFGLTAQSSIEDIEQFYEELRTLSLDDKIMVRPDQLNKKQQDLIKLKDKTDAS